MTEYILFLLGIVVLGDIMLVPLIYFAVTNSLSLSSVLLVGFLGSTIADLMWYFMGMFFRKDAIYRFFKLHKLEEKNKKFFALFQTHDDKILFISKFLYGLRVPVRVLCGIQRMNLKSFITINVLGSAVWLILVSGLAFTLDVSAEELKLYVFRSELAFLFFFVLVILLQVLAKKHINRFLNTRDRASDTVPHQERQKH